MRRFLMAMVALMALLMLAGCAPAAVDAAGPGAAGFWQGLWNGFTALFTFLISLFNPKVGIYEVNNTGGWYDFGFILGVMMFWGGGGGAAGRR